MKVDMALLEHLDLALKGSAVLTKEQNGAEFAAFLAGALAGEAEIEPEVEEIIGNMAEGDLDLTALLDHLADGKDLPAGSSEELQAALYQLQQLIDRHAVISEVAIDGKTAHTDPGIMGKAGLDLYPLNTGTSGETDTKMKESAEEAGKAGSDLSLKEGKEQLKANQAGDLSPFEQAALKEASAKALKGQGATEKALQEQEKTAASKFEKAAAQQKTAVTEFEKAATQQKTAVTEFDKSAAQQKVADAEKPPPALVPGGKDAAANIRQVETTTVKTQNITPAAEQSPVFQQPSVQGDDILQASRIIQTPANANLRESIMQQLEGRMVYLRETPANPAEMRMTLHPPELGEVTIRVFSKQGRLSASIIAETPLVKEILESSITELRQRMNFVSIDFEKLDFSTNDNQFDGSGKPGEDKGAALMNQGIIESSGGTGKEGEPALQNAPPGSDLRGIDYWA